ncbi:MAG: fructose-6-phosphate aldolase [Firmicutes bacterium]|nr:fructose-6-phosphate aldolase [Bacillota bacterium]
MQLYLDSANLQEITTAVSWGVIGGLTTNPTLVARETGSFEDLIRQICRLVGEERPVSVEVIGTTAEAMEKEARLLAELAPNVVIKIPIGIEGLKAVHRLSQGPKKIDCNVTLIFSTNQALLAARAGAAYVSPFVGRLDDIGWDGMGLVREMVEILGKHRLEAQVIAASIRHPRHVHEAALAGAQIATIPFKVLEQMTQHPLTDLGIERFLADWNRKQE